MIEKSAQEDLVEIGVDDVDVSFLERMEVKWGGRLVTRIFA